jgi:TatD DNase family protein
VNSSPLHAASQKITPELIDTHTHPYFEHYDEDREKVLARSFEVCQAILCVGAGIPESRKSVELAAKYPGVYASVGIHPHDISRDNVLELDALASLPKVVAIGECGLDYKPLGLRHEAKLSGDKIDPVHGLRPIDKDKQKEVFLYQLDLADKLNLPIIIHARDSWEDLIPLLKGAPPKKGLVHSWTGGLREADEILKLGLHISFSAMITYPANEAIRLIAKMIPEDKMLVETDAPFLPPQPLRGQRNEPANVKMVAEKLAEVRGTSLDEVAASTSANAAKLFKLPL